MLDSKHEPGSSQFVSRTDKTLRFSLRTFQFTVDPDTKVRMANNCAKDFFILNMQVMRVIYRPLRSASFASYWLHQGNQDLLKNPAPTKITGKQ